MLGIFRHGEMESSQYSLNIYRKHIHYLLKNQYYNPKAHILELGPGDSVSTSIYAYIDGFSSTLIDQGSFARSSLSYYSDIMPSHIDSKVLQVESTTNFGWLSKLNSEYLTNGICSLKALPDCSIDFIFSNAVLEHINSSHIEQYIKELYRVLKPGGIMSHKIDYKDHFSGGINHLYFPRSFWERVVAYAPFYTNRLRHPDYVNLFTSLGLTCLTSQIYSWRHLPLHKPFLAYQYSRLDDSILCAHGSHLVYAKDI